MQMTATQWAVGARSDNDVRTAVEKNNRYAAQNPKADPADDDSIMFFALVFKFVNDFAEGAVFESR